MQEFPGDITDLGEPPYCYDSVAEFRADTKRLGEIVAVTGDFSEVMEYARWICSHAAGAASVRTFATAEPNVCWDMDRDSPFYAAESFTEEVSDAAEAFKSTSAMGNDPAGSDPVNSETAGDAGPGIAAPRGRPELEYFVILDDGQTYSGLDGCVVIGIDGANRRARRALEDEDFDALFESADLVEPIAVPARAA